MTSLSASSLSSGTVADGRLSANVSLLGQTIESAEITDGTIVNADINAAAAIADTKLATISTAGKVADSALSANVARRSGGNTFSGDQTITNGHVFLDNGSAIFAKNTDGIQELLLIPRASDNKTYLSYGANGLNIGNSGTSAMLIRSNANVGIGTDFPTSKLQVNGTVTATEVKVADGNFSSAAADTPVRMVRGWVNADGTKYNGSGFSSTRTALGTYQISFTTPFIDTPALFVHGGTFVNFTVGPGSATVNLANVVGISGDFGFNFIAIGGR